MKFLIVIGILLSSAVFAQDIVIHESDKTRKNVDRYNLRAEEHLNGDSSYVYFNHALQIARNIEYYEGQLRACKGLIKNSEEDGDVFSQLEYTLLLVRLYESNGSNAEKTDGYQKLGQLYLNELLYEKASENFERGFNLEGIDLNSKYDAGIWLVKSLRYAGEVDTALLIARTIQFEKELNTFQKLELQKEKAEIYHELTAYDQELGAYHQIISLVKGTKYAHFEPIAWNNVGYASKYLGRESDAKNAFLNTLNSSNDEESELRGAACYNLGLIYHNMGEADSAMIYFDEAKEMYVAEKDLSSIASTLNMMALSYFHQNDMYNAQRQLDQAFEIEAQGGLKLQEAKSHEIQSLFHEKLYDYESSLKSYKRYLSIRDSFLTMEQAKKNKQLLNQYHFERSEKQLRLIWAADELKSANMARERAAHRAEMAALEAEQERDARVISDQEAELRLRQLNEEKLNLENKEKELEISQRDNELKELALEKERLLVSENAKEIKLLAQQNELEKQRRRNEAQLRRNEEQEFRRKLQMIFGALLFILIILIGILFAYRQLRRRKKQIEAQNLIIAQSKREIEAQKEKSEGLLLNILPVAIAEELKRNGVAKPKLYDDISVGFTDFSGFTMISEKLTPEELVQKLDAMFLGFDRIIEKYELQRIKTIGDAYMYAAGLPDEMEDHAIRCVNAGIEIRDFIERFNSELPSSTPKWNIRIGIHSGQVVAGVIGIKKFAYDIWGDTVNTAARMESSGEIGKVNISGSTYAKIGKEFNTVHRGKVHAKNKGEIDMYFVEKL